MNIVIADDEQIILRWLKKNLEELSGEYQVMEVCMNGKQVLNCCLNHKVDVLLVDIRMPVMDGLELLEKLRANKIMPYTIILSAYSDFSYVRDAFKLGARDYLLKTEITKESLQQCLDNAAKWLESSRREKTETKPQALESLISELERYFFEPCRETELDWERYENQFREKCGGKYRVILLRSYGGMFHPEQVGEIISMLFGGKHILVSCKSADAIVLLLEEEAGNLASINQFYDYLIAFGMKEVLLGISDVGNGMKDLEKLWSHMRQMETDMLFYGWIGIVDAYANEEKRRDAVLQMEGQYGKLREYLGNGTLSQVNQQAEALILQASRVVPPTEQLKQGLIDFLLHIYWNQINEEQRSRLKTSGIFALNDAKNIQEFRMICLEQLGILKTFLDENRNPRMYSDSIGKVMEYISRNYSQDISLNDLAGYVHLNRSYLSTSFKKEVGVNINAFLLKYRLERAKELLVSTNDLVQEICNEVGITDSAYFSKQFKKYTGESPLEYCKLHK